MDTRGRPASRHRLELSERDLVVAFKGGDSHAYAVIYRQFRPVAESICQRILGNPEDAAEAAQETMLRVFQGLPRFNGRYLLRAWVARIATNVCLDMIRKRGRRIDEVETPAAEDLEASESVLSRQNAEDPGVLVERMEEGRRVRAKLSELPEHHRDALLMREFDGLSHEEMAMKLGMTPPQVKALLHRAKKGFRRAWELEAERASSFMFPAMFAAPFRWVRRLLSPTKDAVTEVAAPIIQLTAHSAVAQATTAVGERAAAAAGAILVAGTIGIGASVLPKQSIPAPKPAQPGVVVAQDQDRVVETLPSEAAVPAGSGSAASPSPTGQPSGKAPEEGKLSPVEESPSASPTPSPSPSGIDPNPSASPTPSPSPRPAPGYRMSMTAEWDSNDACRCDPTGRLTETRSSGTPSEGLTFEQAWSGAIVDVKGEAALAVRVQYRGRVQGPSGNLNLDLTVYRGDDIWTYRANLSYERRVAADGGWAYDFTGTYIFGGGVSATSPLPTEGKLRSTLMIWEDATPYGITFNLS